MDYLQGNHKYDMILGRDIFYKLQIDISFSDNIIRGNGGAYEGCTSPMKDVTNIAPSAQSHDKNFWKK